MDSPSSGPPMKTGAASLLDGAEGPRADSSHPLWTWPKYFPKEAGVVGAGRIVVAGSGPGSVATIDKRREAPPAPDFGRYIAGRILVASRYTNGVYCESAYRVCIERTQTTSKVPAEMLVEAYEWPGLKLEHHVPSWCLQSA